jgi:hypothetical protein
MDKFCRVSHRLAIYRLLSVLSVFISGEILFSPRASAVDFLLTAFIGPARSRWLRGKEIWMKLSCFQSRIAYPAAFTALAL